ncbi:MAG: TIGR00282 family metallophosphoesterase [Oscillospiraceae bacterium]|jgi:metallophosphoesterase (TIGR00282 family)|nr:TIGR00282 family metallophosphoesterase [Oscillospiraceae bacterium]MCI1990949.1 TIGR00282 family metallophosphoesterase [Oscillospiraceae bacterium]MCI2035037.1 TIGR00282 family metallophosphoesterase [Oscillospiraceae bacterium]
MNILAIGDVVGSIGCRFLRSHLPTLKKLKAIDLVIVNGENSADGNGLTPVSVQYLFDSGADVVTSGNHSFRRRESYDLYDSCETLLRPANFPPSAPGKGFCVVDMGRIQVGVLNLMGVVYMESMESPFDCADRILAKGVPKITVVDFHAEATGEKRSFAWYLDGRVSAVFGTHTHVQTADECVLPKGTGYISDLGMTGPIDSVLGVKPELTIQKMRTKMPVRFAIAEGACRIDGAIFSVDESTGKTISVERLEIR